MKEIQIGGYFTHSNCKYTKNSKDCYLRHILKFYLFDTPLNPSDLWEELNRQYNEEEHGFQVFEIEGQKYRFGMELIDEKQKQQALKWYNDLPPKEK